MFIARFTLAEATPRLASDVVGGKSGQNHPMSRRDPIHIGRMARNAYIRVGWYGGGVLFITTPSERQLHCTCSAPDRPTTSQWSLDEAPTADSGSGTHSHWPSRQHRGVGLANVKRAYVNVCVCVCTCDSFLDFHRHLSHGGISCLTTRHLLHSGGQVHLNRPMNSAATSTLQNIAIMPPLRYGIFANHLIVMYTFYIKF